MAHDDYSGVLDLARRLLSGVGIAEFEVREGMKRRRHFPERQGDATETADGSLTDRPEPASPPPPCLHRDAPGGTGVPDELNLLLSVLEWIFDAVAYAHQSGVIHHDLKPPRC